MRHGNRQVGRRERMQGGNRPRMTSSGSKRTVRAATIPVVETDAAPAIHTRVQDRPTFVSHCPAVGGLRRNRE